MKSLYQSLVKMSCYSLASTIPEELLGLLPQRSIVYLLPEQSPRVDLDCEGCSPAEFILSRHQFCFLQHE